MTSQSFTFIDPAGNQAQYTVYDADRHNEYHWSTDRGDRGFDGSYAQAQDPGENRVTPKVQRGSEAPEHLEWSEHPCVGNSLRDRNAWANWHTLGTGLLFSLRRSSSGDTIQGDAVKPRFHSDRFQPARQRPSFCLPMQERRLEPQRLHGER